MITTRVPQLGPNGEGWVALQLVLFGGIAIAGLTQAGGRPPIAGPQSVVGGVLLVAGGLLAFLAVSNLGASLSPLPRPVRGNQLRDTGAYRLIRHPIYSGIVLAAGGWSVLTGSWVALALTVILFLLFDAKSRREEVWLLQAHPEYAAYRSRTRRFVPWLY